MAIILHGITGSPPVRAIMLVCKALGVEYEFRNVNLLAGEHLKPEFIKINPLHTVPTIEDGDFAIWDSHAIATYLAEKTDNDSWYPKDLKKRAIVNQRLHFDNALLFTRLRDALEPLLLTGEYTSFPAERIKRLEASLELLENLVQESGWLAGENPTIADCCVVASVSSILTAIPSIKVPKKVAAWLKRCEEELPEYNAVNKPGLEMLEEMVKSKLK